MRALERGEIAPDDAALVQHLDACLGCRGCEPVCPSGVAYGRGLEQARERLFRERGLSPWARAVLGVFRHERVWRPLFRLARLFRATGIPAWMVRITVPTAASTVGKLHTAAEIASGTP